MLDAVLTNCNKFARLIICGMISQYNLEENKLEPIYNITEVVTKSLSMRGFIIFDHWAQERAELPPGHEGLDHAEQGDL